MIHNARACHIVYIEHVVYNSSVAKVMGAGDEYSSGTKGHKDGVVVYQPLKKQ
jgi:hypothetical protein